MQRGLLDHASRPLWDESRSSRGGELLLALQNRAAMSGRCVVSGAYADGGTITSAQTVARREAIAEAIAQAPTHEPHLYEGWATDPRDPAVSRWLLQAGVRRIIVGHKPSGDSPAVLSASYTGVEVISADTSYADTTSHDGRGVSIACVSLQGPSLDVNCARVYGTLRDGRQHDVRLPTLVGGAAGGDLPHPEGGDPVVGRELDDGWWVKALMVGEGADLVPNAEGAGRPASADDSQTRVYLCCRGSGRNVEYRDEVVRG